jgi:hypothetical protein
VPELRFRDGVRVVPDYMATLMVNIDTRKLSYNDAIRAMNHELENSHVERAMRQIVDRHIVENNR